MEQLGIIRSERQRTAGGIDSEIIRSLTVAKMALESGQLERAAAAISEALRTSRSNREICDLPLAPGVLARRRAKELSQQNELLESRVRTRTRELEGRTKELQVSLEELDAFAHTVSHDLKAPLRAMEGFSGILLDQSTNELDNDSIHYLKFIRQSTRRMQTLIEGLLDFSRLGHRVLSVTPLSPVILARRALLDLGASGDQRNTVVDIHDLPDCQADPTLLQQVFVNLMSNALKFTRDVPKGHVEVGSVEREGTTAYYVRDNGIGFEPRHADKIFGVFQRLHSVDKYEGTGIGLASVQRIVERHGGRVWSESAVGKGATFYFTLAPQRVAS